MILNVPAIAQMVACRFEKVKKDAEASTGIVIGIHSPRVADVQLSANLPEASGLEIGWQRNGRRRNALADRIVKVFCKGPQTEARPLVSWQHAH